MEIVLLNSIIQHIIFKIKHKLICS